MRIRKIAAAGVCVVVTTCCGTSAEPIAPPRTPEGLQGRLHDATAVLNAVVAQRLIPVPRVGVGDLRFNSGSAPGGLGDAAIGAGCSDQIESALFRQVVEAQDAERPPHAALHVSLPDCDRHGAGSVDVDTTFTRRGDRDVGLEVLMREDHACTQRAGQRLCQDGAIQVAVAVTGEREAELTTVWRVHSTGTASSGMPIDFEAAGSLQQQIVGGEQMPATIVLEVPDKNGATVVVGVTHAQPGADGSFTLTGADGTDDCTLNADGSGSCRGDVEVSWTADEFAEVAAAEAALRR